MTRSPDVQLMADKRARRTSPREPDLLVQFQQGDPDAFKEIVRTYQERLVQFFYRLCWDLDRSEDFTQELFMKLLRGAKRYRPQGRMNTFIYRVATNLWIDHYRAQRPQPRLYSLDQAMHPGEVDHTAAAPEAVAVDKEQKQSLRRALESLTEPHRLVFELAVYQELPYARIAQVLRIPVGTVKSRMHNSVQALRKVLCKHGEMVARETPPAKKNGGCAG